MDAIAWADEQLRRRNERVLQQEQVRSGPAGATTLLRGERQRFYLKTCRDSATHEPALVAALGQWLPDAVPPVVAADPAQGWLLLADAGPTLRAVIRADRDRRRSMEMVRRLAALQKGALRYVEPLLALGVPDRRLDLLPALYEALIADLSALRVGYPDGVSEHELARLRAFASEVGALCARLAAFGLPATLQHDDFHSGNVAFAGGQYRLLDWGESFIAHPFYSLLIALRDAKFTLEYDDATLRHMRDVYLACWTDYAPMERLCEALALTHRLAALNRALTWRQVLAPASPDERAANADAVPYWLLTFLHNTPLE